jgi:hypothetical protein
MRLIQFAWLCLLICAGGQSFAAESLTWRAAENRVDADLDHASLSGVLATISRATGWIVFMEPGASLSVSVKFKNLTTNEALSRILGTTSYAISHTNGAHNLYVFKTEAKAATQRIASGKQTDKKDYLIHNELLVRLKKNAKLTIEELAKLSGGNIIGRDDKLRVYRLQFPDEASAAKARSLLESNDSVDWVDSNYVVDAPSPDTMARAAQGAAAASTSSKNTTDCSPVIGLVDTAVQVQEGYDKYIMNPVSVVGDVTVSSDEMSHGTAMAETLLAAMGNSPSKILPVVAYRSGSESTTTYEIACATSLLIQSNVSLINMSLGGTTTNSPAYLTALIQAAIKNGIVVVAAAGNEPGTQSTYPADIPGVIAVTASDANGNLASYANSGDFVSAMASGTSIVSLNNTLWRVEGTSVSAARTSGMLAGKAAQKCSDPSSVTEEVLATLPVKR